MSDPFQPASNVNFVTPVIPVNPLCNLLSQGRKNRESV